MSLHPSLKSSKLGKKHRTVLKRYERLSALKEKGMKKDDTSVFGMPKLKIVRVKVKKEKAEEKSEETSAAATETKGTTQKETKPTAKGKQEKGKK